MDSQGADANVGRRSTRTRTSASGVVTPAPTPATKANSKASSRSSTPVQGSGASTPSAIVGGDDLTPTEVAIGGGRSSRRLNNPEFAAKHKAFMAKVTAATTGSMDTYLTNEIISETMSASSSPATSTASGGNKRKLASKADDQQSSAAKKRRSTRTNSSGVESQASNNGHDCYCWICHKEGEFICCETCPRVFHAKCLQLECSPAEDWVCPECVLVMSAENMDTRSRAMRLLTIDQLCSLLKHALTRMKSVSNADPFLKPVDPAQFPAYKEYVTWPMDLQSLERNIRKKQYGSTEAMLSDCKWILHNCIIFNSQSSKLTSIAKSIVNVCKHEMQEIENCPDCYLNAHVKKDVWFTEACRLPHPLVWAKLKGFPYWPGKLMRLNSRDNHGDVRFFGAHDRAWIPLKDVYVYSEKPPIEVKKKRGNIEPSFEEVEKHRKRLQERFGEVAYAEHKTAYDMTRELDMLKIMLPNFTPPFDIGTCCARRSRSFSCSGSEKSRDATPTPSDLGTEDDDEELDNEESAIEEKFAIVADALDVAKRNKATSNDVEETKPTPLPKLMPIKVKINTKLATVSLEKLKIEKPVKHEVSTAVVVNKEDGASVGESNKSCDNDVKVTENSSKIIDEDQEMEEMKEPVDEKSNDTSAEQRVEAPQESSDLPEKEQLVVDTKHHKEDIQSKEQEAQAVKELQQQAVKEQQPPAVTTPMEEESTEVTKVSEKADDSDATVKAATDVETVVVEAASDENVISSTARVTISPPCEVTSTTLNPPTVSAIISADDTIAEEVDEEVVNKSNVIETEGYLADSNNEKIIIEGEDEIDEEDLEMVVEEPDTEPEEKASDSVPTIANQDKAISKEKDSTKELSEDKNKNGDEDEITKKKTPLDYLGSCVGLTITKKSSPEKKKDTESPLHKKENDTKGSEKSASESQSPGSSAEKKRKLSEDNVLDTSDAELTISKVKRISTKEFESSAASASSRRSTPSPHQQQQLRRHSQNASPVAAAGAAAGSSGHPQLPPPYLPRYPGMRPGMHHMRPMMPMLGPNGMMVRGPPPPHFRGAAPNRPPLMPTGPLNLPPNLPSTAGPVAEQLNKVAKKLADSLKNHFLESLSGVNDDLEDSNPQESIKKMKTEIERAEWRHQQELADLKHNADLVIVEMRQAMEAEKQKALHDCKKQAEVDKQSAIKEMKKKQWCAHCGKEAIFYCCWNTSYCDYPCQQAHWPSHMNTCAQNTGGGSGRGGAAAASSSIAAEEDAGLVADHHQLALQQQYLQQQHHQHQLAAAAAASRNAAAAAAAAARQGMMMGGNRMRFMRPPNRMGGGHPMQGYPRPYFM